MHTRTLSTLVVVTAGLLLGCEQPRVDRATPATPPIAAQTAPSAPGAGHSIDQSLPTPGAVPLERKTGTDSTADSTVTPQERDTKMPLPGQANDHSSPEFAKKGAAVQPIK